MTPANLETEINQLLQNSRVQIMENHGLPVAALHLLREDLIHPEISGNKLRKLKYNLLEANRLGYKTLLTFGGAYSNHIAATAAAGQLFGFKTIGIIRGDELNAESNPTLREASEKGMLLKFISRIAYQERNNEAFLEQLKNEYPGAFIIPEGGANKLGLKGCGEIIPPYPDYTHVVCACGTGTTLAGIISTLPSNQAALGISVLKGDFLINDINRILSDIDNHSSNWIINNAFHFGGYGKTNPALLQFISDFQTINRTFVEPIYTGKMLFALYQLIEQGYFPRNSRILAIHTGGLQGWRKN